MDQKMLCFFILLFIITGKFIEAKPNSCSIDGCGDEGCSIQISEYELRKMNEKYDEYQRKFRKHNHAIQEHQEEMPDHFDARKKWPKCKSIGEVHDQSTCASCYAVSVAAAITDRICIATEGKQQPIISSADIMSCCKKCWHEDEQEKEKKKEQGNGCKLGKTPFAWIYWKENGLVTGGKHGNKDTCLPYEFLPCRSFFNKHKKECKDRSAEDPFQTSTCEEKCQPSYKKSKKGVSDEQIFNQDKYFGGLHECIAKPFDKDISIYEDKIKRELFKNGPMTALMVVYTDFREYQKGTVYVKKADAVREGGHSVKLIGWGHEKNGDKFWLAMNSWGSGWGDNGVFKILMGQEAIRFETQVCHAEFDIARTKEYQKLHGKRFKNNDPEDLTPL